MNSKTSILIHMTSKSVQRLHQDVGKTVI